MLEADGIVKAVKDGFGFIERADIEGEIFFHFSEFDIPERGNMQERQVCSCLTPCSHASVLFHRVPRATSHYA